MTDAVHETLKAVVSRLKGGMSLPVYGDVPDNEGYPYIAMGDTETVADGDKEVDGEIHTITIYVYRNEESRKGVLADMNAIRNLLRGAALTISGQAHIGTDYLRRSAGMLKAGAETIWVGEIVFEVQTQAT